MAKFVVAGRSDCPYFARAELLGDRLAKNLTKFKLHKIMVQPDQWDAWLKKTCDEKGWEFYKSPIVWRELIDRGGKGVLIGGANEFQEYVKAYYDLESDMNSYDMRTVSDENKITKNELDQEEREYKALSKPVHICITNAAHPATYHMASSLASGQVLGPNIELTLRFLVRKEEDLELVRGLAMESEDLAHSLLRGVKVFTKPEEAFVDCSYIIIMDELLQEEGESKADWLKRNHQFYSDYAGIINDKSFSSCKVMITGNGPLNFNAMAVQKKATKLARQNIVAVSTVVENQAKAVVGERLTVNPAGVVNLIVWGNINSKHFFDVNRCRIHGYDGAIWGPYWHSVDAREMVHDNKWLSKEFSGLVTTRKHKLAETMGHAAALSTANAICTTLEYWCRGSPTGQVFSLGVYSENWYKVPEGYYFSVPVTMDPKGFWHVVQDIEVNAELGDNIQNAVNDVKLQQAIFKGEISEHDKELGVQNEEAQTSEETIVEKETDGQNEETKDEEAGAAASAEEVSVEEPSNETVVNEGGATAGEEEPEEALQTSENQGEATSGADNSQDAPVVNEESAEISGRSC